MERYEWLVFTCRACRGVIKLSPGMPAKQVICPRCRTKVSVPADAIIVQEEATAAPQALPAARTNSAALKGLRGTKDEWEVNRRPTGGDPALHERLQDTKAAQVQPDAEGQPEIRRVDMRRRKFEQTHPDFDDPAPSSRRRRSSRKFRSNGQAFTDTFMKGLIVAVIVLAAVAGWLGWKQYQKPKPEDTAPPPYVQDTSKAPDGKQLEMRSMADYGPALRETIQKFVSARSVDEMLPLVRDRERVEPKIRAYYNAANPWKPIEVNNRFSPEDLFTVDGDFIVVQLILANFDEVPLSLEHRDDRFFVDWESFTGYGEMSWEEFREKRPEEPVLMRAVIEKGPHTEYFNEAFSDPGVFNCYMVRDAASQHVLSGYTRKESPPDLRVRQWLQKVSAPAEKFRVYAVVRLRFPAGAKNSDQVEITEFLENGWVFRPDRK